MDFMEKNNIETLISIHKIDKQLIHINEKRGSLPNKIEKMNVAINSLIDNISDNESRKVEIEKRKNEINGNLSDSNTKIEALNNQMYDVKSNKEYEALLIEIDHLKGKLKDEKTEISNFDSELETLINNINSSNKDLEDNKTKLSDFQIKLDDANSEIINEEKDLITSKENILKEVSEDLIDLYNEKKEEYGLAFASITRKSCSNCFSSLPPQAFINVTDRNKLQTCPSCNIFLYIEDENIDLKD
tara:strand:+ start:1121 stop:1855 length:735 start_codon:yes stop_codon:yes gene_type:complete